MSLYNFGKYNIVRRLGSGGFATTYLAKDTLSGNDVAIKVFHNKADSHAMAMAEAHTIKRLDHPNVIKYLDCNSDNGQFYICFELANGGSLRGRIGDLDETLALSFAQQIATGMEYVHRNGILHRDLKPDNILLVDGHVKIGDFGIGKITAVTQQNTFSGTVIYQAPETILRGEVSIRSDMWSYGVLLYELVHGERPFNTVEEILKGEITWRAGNQSIRDIGAKCLSVESSKRPAGFTEIINSLAVLKSSSHDSDCFLIDIEERDRERIAAGWDGLPFIEKWPFILIVFPILSVIMSLIAVASDMIGRKNIISGLLIVVACVFVGCAFLEGVAFVYRWIRSRVFKVH